MNKSWYYTPILALVACGSAPPAPTPIDSPAPPVAAAQPAPSTAPTPFESRVPYEIARSLADEVGPRLTGSAGDRRATAWALATMKRIGLENVHAEPVTAPAWERGEEKAQVVGAAAHQLVVTALGWSPATPAAGIEAEIVELDSLAALKALAPGAVRGKIVFFNHPIQKQRDGSGYGDGVGLRFAGPNAAAELGASAVLVRSVGTDHDRVAHTGATAKDAKIPAAALAVPDAELLHRLGSVRVRLTLTPKIRADVQTANVVGDRIGTQRKDEIVLLGAHLDSWDLASGAVDDAAGCGIVLGAADLLIHGARPARTVRIVLFAAEESSGAGGRAYATVHTAEVARHVLAIEADAGSGAPYAFAFRGDAEHRRAFFSVAPQLAALDVVAEDKPAYGGSDIGPLLQLGVPVADIRQDMTRYFDVHHTANDTVMELDAPALAKNAAAFATLARFAADAPADLGRVPDELRERRH